MKGISAAKMRLNRPQRPLHIMPVFSLRKIGGRLVSEFERTFFWGFLAFRTRRSDYFFKRSALGEKTPEKGGIRRIFEKPSNEICHTWDELSHGCIDPHPVSHLSEFPAQGVSHAVKHLELKVAFGEIQRLR